MSNENQNLDNKRITGLDIVLLLSGLLVLAVVVFMFGGDAQSDGCATPTPGPNQAWIKTDGGAVASVIRDATAFDAFVCDASGERQVAYGVPLRGAAVLVCPDCVKLGWYKNQMACWKEILSATTE